MPNFKEPTYCEVVVHVRSLDHTENHLHSTMFYPRVKNFEINTDVPDDFATNNTTVYMQPKTLGVSVEFEAMLDDNKYQALHVNSRVAEPNLDILLATFTMPERVKIAMEYVRAVENRIDELVNDLGADEIQTYLGEMYTGKDDGVEL